MRSVILFVGFLLFCSQSWAQSLSYASRLLEYHPAPGQYINDPATGTPGNALQILNGIGNPLSLGAYGGYIVLGFDAPVTNSPDNPYGVDFIIYGNGSPTHAEPGIVRVMRDQNHNGIPDDTSYEIAGSAHFTKDYLAKYSITYHNPGLYVASDVPWSDNSGNSGKVFKNSFHSQPYYPLNSLFTGIPTDSMSFSGSRLTGEVKMQNGVYVSLPYCFGYADNTPLQNENPLGIPDNPYTTGVIEGDGGDAIDISWAIDDNGNYIDLPEIDFVMIYTAVNENAGWLGEISTEIRGIIDVDPNPGIKAPVKMILATEIPSKTVVNDSLNLSCRVFNYGKPSDNEKLSWESGNPDVASVINGILISKSPGEAELKCTLISDPTIYIFKKVTVVTPGKIILDAESGKIQEGEDLDVSFSVPDASGDKIDGIIPQLILDDPMIAEIINVSTDHFTIHSKNAGTTGISIGVTGYPETFASFKLDVINRIDPVEIFFSMGNGENSILPGKSYTARKSDILSFTNRHQKNFTADKSYVTLADAIVSILESEGFGKGEKAIAFRQDEYGGDGLYLWQVGINWEYLYGWGGSDYSDVYAKTWFAVVNSKVFASGFDSIEVFNYDRISLYYVEDNRVPWSFTRLIPSKEKIAVGELVSFKTEQIDIYPAATRNFELSGPYPVVGGLVNIEPVQGNVLTPETTFSGEFSLEFTNGGNYKVSVGNSETVVVEVMPALTVEENKEFSIFPDPCENTLNISGFSSGPSLVKIFSINAELKFSKIIPAGPDSAILDVSSLARGIYILEIYSGNGSSRRKLCKL